MSSIEWETRWRSSFRHCFKSRKAAVSICDSVAGILHWLILPVELLALETIQPLTETSTRNYFLGVKAVGA
jgi:hypothetical protein